MTSGRARYPVSLAVPVGDVLHPEVCEGFWRLSPRARAEQTKRMARTVGTTWLTPYVPRTVREQVGTRWITTVVGVVRATDVRALRFLFGDSDRDREACGSCRMLALFARWKADEPHAQWTDTADPAHWPAALRLDAARLSARFARVADATWCIECHAAPWASTTMRCLWCERVGGPPRRARAA